MSQHENPKGLFRYISDQDTSAIRMDDKVYSQIGLYKVVIHAINEEARSNGYCAEDAVSEVIEDHVAVQGGWNAVNQYTKWLVDQLNKISKDTPDYHELHSVEKLRQVPYVSTSLVSHIDARQKERSDALKKLDDEDDEMDREMDAAGFKFEIPVVKKKA